MITTRFRTVVLGRRGNREMKVSERERAVGVNFFQPENRFKSMYYALSIFACLRSFKTKKKINQKIFLEDHLSVQKKIKKSSQE